MTILLTPSTSSLNPRGMRRLRMYDLWANVRWRLSHFKSAAKYLFKDPEEIRATGGTNWMKYLPPRFQRIIFFPELWSESEKADWGQGRRCEFSLLTVAIALYFG